MAELKNSEAYGGLKAFARDYKKFAFGIFSRVRYPRVDAWIAFADGRIEDSLKEKRSVAQSVKDIYALTVLGYIASFVQLWYVWAILGVLFFFLGGMSALSGALTALTSGIALMAVLALLLAFLAVAPALFSLAWAAVFHIILKALGARGSYSDTLNVLVLYSAAHFALSIPIFIAYALIVGFFLGPLAYVIVFYTAYLLYRGMKHVHGMEPRNAAIGTVASFIIAMGGFVAVYLISLMLVFMLGVIF